MNIEFNNTKSGEVFGSSQTFAALKCVRNEEKGRLVVLLTDPENYSPYNCEPALEQSRLLFSLKQKEMGKIRLLAIWIDQR